MMPKMLWSKGGSSVLLRDAGCSKGHTNVCAASTASAKEDEMGSAEAKERCAAARRATTADAMPELFHTTA